MIETTLYSPYRFPAAGEDFSEGPGCGGGEGHAGGGSYEHEGEALAQKKVHHHPGQSGAKGAGKDVEKFVRSRKKPEGTHPQTEGHLDGHIQNGAGAQGQAHKGSQNAGDDIFLKSEDTADGHSNGRRQLELRARHNAGNAEGAAHGNEHGQEGCFAAVCDHGTFFVNG